MVITLKIDYGDGRTTEMVCRNITTTWNGEIFNVDADGEVETVVDATTVTSDSLTMEDLQYARRMVNNSLYGHYAVYIDEAVSTLVNARDKYIIKNLINEEEYWD